MTTIITPVGHLFTPYQAKQHSQYVYHTMGDWLEEGPVTKG